MITTCPKLVDNLEQTVRTQLVDGLFKLATRCEIFTRIVHVHFSIFSVVDGVQM